MFVQVYRARLSGGHVAYGTCCHHFFWRWRCRCWGWRDAPTDYSMPTLLVLRSNVSDSLFFWSYVFLLFGNKLFNKLHDSLLICSINWFSELKRYLLLMKILFVYHFVYLSYKNYCKRLFNFCIYFVMFFQMKCFSF